MLIIQDENQQQEEFTTLSKEGKAPTTERVPTLLNNPTETLQCHLKGYTILDCEPLDDIKGHIDNLLQELPHILETALSNEVEVSLS